MCIMKNIFLLALLLLMYCHETLSLFQLTNKRASLKAEILSLAEKCDRGLIETQDEKIKMRKLFEVLLSYNHNHNQ